MAQDNNHLLQDSYTDLLETSNAHTYDGIFPINVNNDNDTISIDPIAKTVIEPSDTVHVETDTNLTGNTVYKLHVPHSVIPTYTGENPVVVNNTTKKISVNKLPMEIKEPLYAVVSPEKVSLGCNTENYYTYSHYYDGAIATASISTGDTAKIIDMWNYTDLSDGELITGTLFVEGFLYARQGYVPVDDILTVRLYFENDNDVEYDIYKELKRTKSSEIDQGTIIIPFTLHYTEVLRIAHAKVRLQIKSSSNVFLQTTANVYFDGYRKQAIV